MSLIISWRVVSWRVVSWRVEAWLVVGCWSARLLVVGWYLLITYYLLLITHPFNCVASSIAHLFLSKKRKIFW